MQLGSHVAVAVELLAAAAPIQPLAWEPPYALKSKKTKQNNNNRKKLVVIQVEECFSMVSVSS